MIVHRLQPEVLVRDRLQSQSSHETTEVDRPLQRGAAREIECADDAELMQALNASNPFCLGLLFQRYSGLVLAVALRILRDHCEAEEVTQEVFLYIYEKPQLFDPSKGSAKSWILRIAGSRALDRKLYLARRGFYASIDVRSLNDTLVCTSDLELEIICRLNRKRLEQALALLTSIQRQTIECFYFDDLDLREISDRLGEPLGNVRHHLYRGLARLRKSCALNPCVKA